MCPKLQELSNNHAFHGNIFCSSAIKRFKTKKQLQIKNLMRSFALES